MKHISEYLEMAMRDIEGDENMRLWQEAMSALKAGNADAAEAVANRMKVASDARLVREKAKAIRQSVRSNDDKR